MTPNKLLQETPVGAVIGVTDLSLMKSAVEEGICTGSVASEKLSTEEINGTHRGTVARSWGDSPTLS
jgi:hypothetical protein